jgi:dUTP pyrophosphatase
MNEAIYIKAKRIDEKYSDIPLPSYATEGSAGMDIRAAVENDITLKANQFTLIPTNISVEIPAGFEIQVRPRSGLAAKHGIGLLNSPGTIDSDYRGEIKIILFNFSSEDFIIKRGDRIAQLLLARVYKMNFQEEEDLNSTSRGSGGFGHTGKE